MIYEIKTKKHFLPLGAFYVQAQYQTEDVYTVKYFSDEEGKSEAFITNSLASVVTEQELKEMTGVEKIKTLKDTTKAGTPKKRGRNKAEQEKVEPSKSADASNYEGHGEDSRGVNKFPSSDSEERFLKMQGITPEDMKDIPRINGDYYFEVIGKNKDFQSFKKGMSEQKFRNVAKLALELLSEEKDND